MRTGPATYADLVGLPEPVVGEILDGELMVSLGPGRDMQKPLELGRCSHPAVSIWGRGPGGWRILLEPELHVGGD